MMSSGWDKWSARPIPVDKAYLHQVLTEIIKKFSAKLRRSRGEMLSDHFKRREPIGVVVHFTEVGRDEDLRVAVHIDVGDKWSYGRRRQFVQKAHVLSVEDTYRPDRGDLWKVRLVMVMYDRPVEDILSNLQTVQKEMRSILLHEYTHLRDRIYERDTSSGEDREHGEEYYNRPAEVRAFMAQIVDETLESAWNYLKGMNGWVTTRGIMDHVLGIHDSLWNRLRDQFSPRNQKLIRKAIYKAVDENYDRMMTRYERMSRRLKLPFDPPESWKRAHRIAARITLAKTLIRSLV
jgi:hypothetical protein